MLCKWPPCSQLVAGLQLLAERNAGPGVRTAISCCVWFQDGLNDSIHSKAAKGFSGAPGQAALRPPFSCCG